jgi:23S rRNA (cytosine1962-C5)-methyltransferase
LPDIKTYTPGHWDEYELIDSGGLEKLERFGKYILTRPEPQAVWSKSLSPSEWEKLSHAVFTRTKGIDPTRLESTEKGNWKRKPGTPDQWFINYFYKEMKLRFRLGFTSFGHIGVFPEQAVNWEYVYEAVKSSVGSRQSAVGSWQSAVSSQKWKSDTENREPRTEYRVPIFRVLNLFAYTGGASLAAKAAGADVVHVDSVKQVISWAGDNMLASGMKDIRWVVEDAMKFVKREAKRGNKYNGIILDPPAYGRGPEGEKWVLQDSVNELVRLCSDILEEKNSFFILSLYSMGFSALISESLVNTHFRNVSTPETGELCFKDRAGRNLPLGTLVRFRR